MKKAKIIKLRDSEIKKVVDYINKLNENEISTIVLGVVKKDKEKVIFTNSATNNILELIGLTEFIKNDYIQGSYYE